MTANNDMSSREYEREAEASRHRLASSLRELSDRLSPGQIMDEVLTYAKGGGGTFLTALTSAAKQNPVPSLLIGAGLMMFLSEKTGLASLIGGHSDNAQSNGNGGRHRDDRSYGGEYGGRYDARYDDRPQGASGGVGRAMGGIAEAGRNAVGGIAEAGRNAAGGIAAAGAGVAGAAASGVRSAAEMAMHGAGQVGAAVAGAAGAARDAAANVAGGVAQAGGAVGSRLADVGAGIAGTADHMMHRAQDTAGDIMHRAQDFGGAMGERAGMAGQRFYDGARQAPHRVTDSVNQAKDNLNHMVGEQPLATGALGLAIGAIVAALLPKTEAEDKLMGETADQVKHAVGAVAAHEMEAAKDAAASVASSVATKVMSDVVSEVSKAAEDHGISTQSAADAVHSVSDKLKEAVGLQPREDGEPETTRSQT